MKLVENSEIEELAARLVFPENMELLKNVWLEFSSFLSWAYLGIYRPPLLQSIDILKKS